MELMTFKPFLWLVAVGLLIYVFHRSLVNRPTAKKSASFIMRLLGVILLILALCRPYMSLESDALHVVFIVDISESVDLDDAMRAVDEIETSIEKLSPSDSYSLLIAGKDIRTCETTQAMRDTLNQWRQGLSDSRFRSDTDLSKWLLSARFAFRADKARRLVLYSDGVSTSGDCRKALDTLAAEKIEMRFARLKSLQQPEVSVVSITPSVTTAYKGQVVRLKARLASNIDTSAQLRLLRKGVVVQEKQIRLTADDTSEAVFDVRTDQTGSISWTAELTSQQDHFAVNNHAVCSVNVKGQPRLLILHQEPQAMRPFARVLEQQDYEVDVRGKFGLPNTIQEMLAFDAIILADIAASDLTVAQMHMLKSFVTDFGGGLAMFGSENSYGLGGYYKTPVEQTLPLVSRFEKEKEKPSLAMALVMDKSGSMQGLPIELAKQAAKSAVELLSARDQVAVIAFDSNASVISEMRSAVDAESIKGDIDMLAAGGGTFMYPGMEVAYDMLQRTAAKIKHVIILSDGQSQPADHEGLAAEMADFGITVSTVAMGNGADRQLLSAIANIGKGRYYETNDPANVPQIFTRETMQASKSAIKEDVYAPLIIGDHPMLAGFTDDDLPFSYGYVMAKPKPTAQVLLALETGDPLMAVSRFGLGVGMAYTSDMTEKWGGEWLVWDECGSFWAQVFRSIVQRADADGVYVATHTEEDKWIITIQRQDVDARPLNQINWQLRCVDQDNNRLDVTTHQTGLGLYSATIPLTNTSNASLSIYDTDYDKLAVVHYDRPYPAEYNLMQNIDKNLLDIDAFEPEQVRADIVAAQKYRPVSNLLMIIAMLLSIGGILLRRI